MSAVRADPTRLSASSQRSSERYVLLTSIFVFRYLWLIFFTVSSFFLSPRQIFCSLPSVVTWLVPQSKICVAPTVSPIPVKNIQGFIEYLCGLEKTRKKGSRIDSFTSTMRSWLSHESRSKIYVLICSHNSLSYFCKKYPRINWVFLRAATD